MTETPNTSQSAEATVVCSTVRSGQTAELIRGGFLMLVRWFVAYPVVYLSYYVKGLQRAPWRVGADRNFNGVGIIAMNHRNAFHDVLISQIAGPQWNFFLIDPEHRRVPLWYMLCRACRAITVTRKTDRTGKFRFRRKTTAFLQKQDWASKRLDTLEEMKQQQAKNIAQLSELLVQGHWINVFPEGLSRISPKLGKLRIGVARIALEAQEKSGWTLPLKIFPLGLNYENQFIGGSTVIAQWGRSVDVLKYRELYLSDKTKAEQALMAEIESELKNVMIEAESEEQLVQAYRLAHQRKDLTFGGVRRALADIAAGRDRLPNLKRISLRSNESVVYQLLGYGIWAPLALLAWPFRMFGRWCSNDRSEEMGYTLLLWLLCLIAGAIVSEWRWVAQLALVTWLAAQSWLWAWRRGIVD